MEEKISFKPTYTDLNFWSSEWEKRSINFHKDNRHPYDNCFRNDSIYFIN